MAEPLEQVLRLKWLSAPPAWAVFLLLLGLGLGALLVYRYETGTAGGRRRTVMGLCRLLALALVLAILFTPVLSTETVDVQQGIVTVLLDTSLSMNFADRFSDRDRAQALADALGVDAAAVEERTRLELYRRLLGQGSHPVLARLNAHNRLQVYAFDEHARLLLEVPKGAYDKGLEAAMHLGSLLDGLKATGKVTALGDALARALRDLRGQPAAGIVLLTDGRSNRGQDLARVQRELARRGVPVHAVGVGNPDPPKDLALSNLQASEVVLAEDQVPFFVTLSSRGFAGESVEVVLEVAGQVVARQQAIIPPEETPQVVNLQFQPRQEGELDCVIRVAPRPGELLRENNAVGHQLLVVKQKIRVLYVEGLPRFEYRHLVPALIRDRTMRVQCYLTSADVEFPQEVTDTSDEPGEPLASLERLPDTREALGDYHVILLGDVDLQDPSHFSREKLELMRAFVGEMGGGILFMSGINHQPQGLRGTPLEDLLPVTLYEDAELTLRELTQTYHPQLTAEGQDDPITRLVDDRERNIELWEDRDGSMENSLPGLYWHARCQRAKPGARVLAAHPGSGTPLVALQFYRAGRTLYSGVDETWRWKAGVGNRHFYRYWSQAIRFLAAGKLLGRTRRHSLTTDRSAYTLGDTALVAARVLDPEFRPSTQPHQIVYVKRDGGSMSELRLEAESGKPGHFQAPLPLTELGGYRIWIGSRDEHEPREAYRAFRVEVPPLEYENPRLDAAVLRELAEQTGGSYRDLAALDQLPERIPSVTQRVARDVSDREIWDHPGLLIALALVLGLEWILRRQGQML